MKRALNYWETALVVAVIAYGCFSPYPHVTLPSVAFADKWIHMLMYVVLAGVLTYDMLRVKVSGWRLWLTGILFPTMFGGFVELMQYLFFYPRTGDWLDLCADFIGTIIGFFLVLIEQKLWKTFTI